MTNSVDAARARERERLVVAPADLGRRVRVGGERDRDSGVDDAAAAAAARDTPPRPACAVPRRRSRRRSPPRAPRRSPPPRPPRARVAGRWPCFFGRSKCVSTSKSRVRGGLREEAVVLVVERLGSLAFEAAAGGLADRRSSRRRPSGRSRGRGPSRRARQPRGELLLVALGVVGLEAEADGDPAGELLAQRLDLARRSPRTGPRASRASGRVRSGAGSRAGCGR